MKKIFLTQGKFSLVDDSDFDFLNQWKWHYNAQGYAIRRQWFKGGSSKFIRMHRLINETPNDLETDHINRNKLDNRRSNLRSVTKSQNSINKGLKSTNTSGCKGVVFDKRRSKWFAQIMLNQKNKFLGYFDYFGDAVKARKKAESIYHSL